ncbi:hypothetical protein LTR59_017902 [Friedmanniomyces endolithicus]|nr:hypothetical protein LTR94_007641 [Friedmanniomyces endolithicus]KAK0768129.1 hypothetical protein LTR59_017902 [Friedmanniomyces endolithicus]KAK0800543.1 hypothetical protein LTR38_007144 [Friedmanniomyces endolithicus]
MTSTQSKACCTVPPVVAEGYKEKGEYLTIEGMKTYATQIPGKSGPKTAKSAILNVYDIFGFFPQTLQGADILAHADAEHQYQVFMPDFFDGKPADITIQAERPDIREWAVVGFCWGGKIVNLVSQEGTLFKAAAACHPAMVDAKDAPGVTIPYAMFPSKDESREDVEAWEKGLKVKNVVKWWPYVYSISNQVHGFMAARDDLKDEKVKADYTKAYEELLSFFHDNM